MAWGSLSNMKTRYLRELCVLPPPRLGILAPGGWPRIGADSPPSRATCCHARQLACCRARQRVSDLNRPDRADAPAPSPSVVPRRGPKNPSNGGALAAGFEPRPPISSAPPSDRTEPPRPTGQCRRARARARPLAQAGARAPTRATRTSTGGQASTRRTSTDDQADDQADDHGRPGGRPRAATGGQADGHRRPQTSTDVHRRPTVSDPRTG